MPANRRRPAIEEARELVALVGALRDNGDTLDAEAVSARLGITPQRAEHMLDLLTQAGGESYANSLPLAADDDSSVTLIAAFANTVRGRSVRLTRAEATTPPSTRWTSTRRTTSAAASPMRTIPSNRR